jgi:hypothetical protein
MPHHNDAVGSGPGGPRRRPLAALLGVGLAVALAASACGGGSAPSSAKKSTQVVTMPPGPACIEAENGGGCLQVAPGDRRVDLIRPSFSNPTSITNPLHPSSRLAQVIYGGQVDGKPLRTEFTRLPGTKTITWDGQQVETVVMQYVNYLGGRIEEVALDWFAQADDGAVWYFGEDVFNYADGAVADTKGSWIAGKGGPPAMIMPANPKVGNVYRSENMPKVVFEEVTVKAVGQTVPGPSGPVSGALTANELHFDGKREDKIFAPGYGEFSTGDPTGDLELASLAVPTDARPGPLPAELGALSDAVRAAFDKVGGNDWVGATTATRRLLKAWEAYRSGGVPDQLDRQMQRDVDTLATKVAARTAAEARAAALRVAQNDLDLQLQHRPVVEIDLDRLRLWARQLRVDTAAGDAGAVAGDVTTMEWIRDRVRHTLDQATATRLDDQLRRLRAAADGRDLPAAAEAAPAVLVTLAAA